MDLKNLTLEDLLPHRGRMLLIGEIMDTDESGSVSRSVVSANWPLTDKTSVSPLILIELTAQTAGINNGIQRIHDRGPEDGTMGWIAGVKSAVFHVDALPLGAVLITRTQNSFSYDSFREITGTVSMDNTVVGEITLQLVSA